MNLPCLTSVLPDDTSDYRNSNYKDSSNNRFFLGGRGAQWLSGRVLGSRAKGRGFEPHRCHCIVVLEQDTFILA